MGELNGEDIVSQSGAFMILMEKAAEQVVDVIPPAWAAFGGMVRLAVEKLDSEAVKPLLDNNELILMMAEKLVDCMRSQLLFHVVGDIGSYKFKPMEVVVGENGEEVSRRRGTNKVTYLSPEILATINAIAEKYNLAKHGIDQFAACDCFLFELIQKDGKGPGLDWREAHGQWAKQVIKIYEEGMRLDVKQFAIDREAYIKPLRTCNHQRMQTILKEANKHR